jgi:hypothetical protein
VNIFNAAERSQHELVRALVDTPARNFHVLGANRASHLIDRKPVSLQLIGIEP